MLRILAAVLATFVLLVAAALPLVALAPRESARVATPLRAGDMPWRAAGLDERQAAAHLLARFTFGARPGDVDRVVATGLERWFEQQLAGVPRDVALDRRLAALPTLDLDAGQLAATYPNLGLVIAQARRAGVLPAKGPTAGEAIATRSAAPARGAHASTAASPRRDPELRGKLLRFVAAHGYRRQGELLADLLTQKLVRAVYAEDQLGEVMTDFWFNHFNVSLTDPKARVFVLAFERDAIRPHVRDPFATLLAATARQPAMLLYLDNARSVAPAGAPTTVEAAMARRNVDGRFGWGRLGAAPSLRATFARPPAAGGKGPTGLNENYARELLELHTLGVDGGYSQQDVIAVARALSGWTVVPPRTVLAGDDEWARRRREARGARLGFVHEGEFLFRADRHDAGQKTILGVTLPAGRGMEDGEQVLAMLATHPATARHLARQLAVRFVADEPPAPLVDRLAAAFTRSGGDTREMLREIVRAPELWAPSARVAKVKSPFELAVSALRALDADVESPAAVLDWVGRMGQPLYRQSSPAGWPDRGSQWVSTGGLLARMNFGLALASGELAGVRVDLPALVGSREPESATAALATYAALLLPARDLDAALPPLVPLVTEPALRANLADRLAGRQPLAPSTTVEASPAQRLGYWENPFPDYRPGPARRPDLSLVARVVGVLLGSPEFQRR